MWRALRAELAYFRPWLLGGLGIAAGISVLMHVLKWLVNDGEGVPGFLTNMFLFIGGMVVAFIAQSYRSEERRARLLLAGPLTPRQLAGVLVLLPACLVGIGVILTALKIGLVALFTGTLNLADLRMTASFAGEFWAYAQLGPLAQESSAARRQGRGQAATAGWALFSVAVLVLAASMIFRGSIQGFVGQLMVLVAAMTVAFALYQRRTDFTR
jgi:hypothetical protein